MASVEYTMMDFDPAVLVAEGTVQGGFDHHEQAQALYPPPLEAAMLMAAVRQETVEEKLDGLEQYVRSYAHMTDAFTMASVRRYVQELALWGRNPFPTLVMGMPPPPSSLPGSQAAGVQETDPAHAQQALPRHQVAFSQAGQYVAPLPLPHQAYNFASPPRNGMSAVPQQQQQQQAEPRQPTPEEWAAMNRMRPALDAPVARRRETRIPVGPQRKNRSSPSSSAANSSTSRTAPTARQPAALETRARNRTGAVTGLNQATRFHRRRCTEATGCISGCLYKRDFPKRYAADKKLWEACSA